jgi:hypothetical protein
MMRMESNRAPGTFNQLRVALLHGLTYKLFSLCYKIEAIKAELEVRRTPLCSHRAADDGALAEGRQTAA